MTTAELFEKYEERFGEPPVIFVGDPESLMRGKISEALVTGKPWTRTEDEQEQVIDE